MSKHKKENWQGPTLRDCNLLLAGRYEKMYMSVFVLMCFF